jgi:hypothetical protein
VLNDDLFNRWITKLLSFIHKTCFVTASSFKFDTCRPPPEIFSLLPHFHFASSAFCHNGFETFNVQSDENTYSMTEVS